MGAYRCPVCSTNWPLQTDYATCPTCEVQCTHRPMEEPHPDWEVRLAVHDLDVAADPVIDWREEALEKVGVPRDTAIEWAEARDISHGGWVVDVYSTVKDIERYLAQGATLEQALRIVAPL